MMMMFCRATSPSRVCYPSLPSYLPRFFLFTGSGDHTVRLWDVSTQLEVAVLEGHTTGVWSVAFDVSGTYLASGGARGVTCDGGGDSDNNGDCDGKYDNDSDCDGEWYDGGDYCRKHGHVDACDHLSSLSCSSSQALVTIPCVCGT
jgi:WD40 repeat protein